MGLDRSGEPHQGLEEMNCQMSGSCCVADECSDVSHYMKSGRERSDAQHFVSGLEIEMLKIPVIGV